MSNTDRPTATYPTADRLARLEHEEAAHAAHRERLADLWADQTPTEELPVQPRPLVRTNAPSQYTPSQHEQGAHFVKTNETPLQDMGRPGILSRPSLRWHPSLMQLAIGAALVAALLGACNVAAIQAHRAARAYCHALAVSDWARAERECRGTGSGTTAPEQPPSSPHTPSSTPSGAPSPSTPPALTRVTIPSPSTQPPTQPSPTAPASSSPAPATPVASTWVTSDTRAPYDRTDASASPLDLPRCTTRSGTSPDPSDALPCLASLSADGSRAVVLEEDASLTGLVRR